MALSFHNYRPVDYSRIAEFLVHHHQPANRDGNWLQPMWEYMHSHPLLDVSSLDRIGIWEDGGEIVAVAHFEWRLGEAFFQFHPAFRSRRAELLDYAEANLCNVADGGQRVLHAYINDDDPEFTALAQERGYRRNRDEDRPLSILTIPFPFPENTLPPGFRLISLADECDWVKLDRVLWRGFNHPGEPPEGEVEERKLMSNTPNYRFDLKIVAQAPGGEYASFCGMWFQPENGFAYVEPVATDPAYRRLGLGRAAVLEGIRRCAVLGARVVYVGSDQLFYQSLGFRVHYTQACWRKEWV